MHGGDREGAPNLVPLLDLVFQLIMFFMITVNFVRVDQLNEDIVLPVAQAATPLDQTAEDWVFLNLDKDGKLIGTIENLDTEGRLKAYLQTERLRLQREAEEKGKKDLNVVIVLRAHRDVRYYRIFEVLDNCSRAGYRSWQLRVKTGE
jgi:biopolymer transport protein ExbD